MMTRALTRYVSPTSKAAGTALALAPLVLAARALAAVVLTALATLVGTAAAGAAQSPPDRVVALTFDDLPMVRVDGGCEPAQARLTTRRLLAGLAAAGAPAAGFVTGMNTCGQPPSFRDSLLTAWIEAGHELGNHSWSHPDLNATPLDAYLADVDRGAALVDSLLARHGRSLRFFRHPQLHAGDTPARKSGLARHLAATGQTVGTVTVDNQEWVYAYVYHRAVAMGDSSLARRTVDAYLHHLDAAFAHAEARSREVLGREIPQVLLLHANRLNADHIDAVLSLIRERGYRFVPLADAQADMAYRRPDPYLGPRGLSWIERWALDEGIEPDEGPREDPWVLEAFRRLQSGG